MYIFCFSLLGFAKIILITNGNLSKMNTRHLMIKAVNDKGKDLNLVLFLHEEKETSRTKRISGNVIALHY